ncbi:MAG: hypothetical protein ACJ76J_04455 [Thermoanaerobaculia bacterium]
MNLKIELGAFEIESLNIEDLNVEELERRLELSSAVPDPMGWNCDCDNYTCTPNCGCNNYTCTENTCNYLCTVDCSGDCSANVCVTNGCPTNTCLQVEPPV